MAHWYQEAVWGLYGALGGPGLLERNRVELAGGPFPGDCPFLLLADHSNALDPWVLGALSRRPIRFMANLEGVSPLKAAFADLVGAYGRRKGSADLGALKRTIALAEGGDSIGIFPEGDRSWDGASMPLRPGSGRLAKRLGLPLVLARQSGNYLSMPRWASTPRRGRWTVELLTFGADEVARYSSDVLECIIGSFLAKDEIREAQREGRDFSGSGLAEGVERLLWQCPVCGKHEDSEGRGTPIRGAGDEISCGRCGSRWRLDANLRVRALNAPHSIHLAPIADLKDWCDWQREGLEGVLIGGAAGDGPAVGGLRAAHVSLSRWRAGALEGLGEGMLDLRDGELVFSSAAARLSFRAGEIRGFVDNFCSFAEFSHGGMRWRLRFGAGNIAKWCFALGGQKLAGNRAVVKPVPATAGYCAEGAAS